MQPAYHYDYAFKFILVGDTGVGKTSLINRFTAGYFNPNHDFTIGVQFFSKNIRISNNIIKLQIWDTAGQQEFKSVTRSYYRSAAAALLVFDITRIETFRNIVRWVEDVKNNGNKDVVLVLIGNKSDLESHRRVTRSQALKLSRDYDMMYIETSAVSQENVERAFSWPADTIFSKVQGGFINVNRDDQAIKVNKNKDHQFKSRANKQCQC